MTETLNTIGWILLAVGFVLIFTANRRSKKIKKLASMTELLETGRFDEAGKRVVALQINVVLAAASFGFMIASAVTFLAALIH